MKKFILTLTVLFNAVAMNAFNFEYEGVFFSFISREDRIVEVSAGDRYSGHIVIPETAICLGDTYSVVAIGNDAFKNYYDITDVTIPSSVTSIGDSAFWGCTGLTSLTIPESVTSIGDYVLVDCVNLTSVNLPNSISSLSNNMFSGCTAMQSISIPSSITSIGNNAFRGCTALESIAIPTSVVSIGNSAFRDCLGLTSMAIPGSVASIGYQAFQGCTGLTSVTIPNSVTSIGLCAFSGCTGLTSVSIPSSVTSLVNATFSGCTGLASVNIPNSVTSIGHQALMNCTGLSSLSIPGSVTSIGDYSLYNCSGLTSIIFEDSAAELSITSKTINSATLTNAYFGRQMDFANVPCTALQTVEFGENVMLIAEGAFKNGSAIHAVISHSTIPPTAINAFSDETYHNGVLYVPNDCIGAYEKAPGWKNFHEIQAIASDVSDGVVDVNGDNGNNHISIVDGAICISVDDNVSVAAASGTIIYSGHGEACINVEPGIYIVMIGHKASKVVVH